MKIVITGSLGNISKPLAIALVQQGHQVTVISSKPEKQKDIEALGAAAAIGKLEDAAFVTATFTGADAVYCMIPFDFSIADQTAYFQKIGNNYAQAIRQASVKRAVILSGWAAHVLTFNAEDIFKDLPGVAITFLRPAIFYSNFYSSMDLIRGKTFMAKLMTLLFIGPMALIKGRTGLLAANYGGDDRIVLVSPNDIAQAAAEEMVTPQQGVKVRYVASDELTCNQTAAILGAAIGKPYLKWVTLTEKQMLRGLQAAKVPAQLAESLVQMQTAIHKGIVQQSYYHNRPAVMGKVKMADFAKEFAAAYNQKK